MCQLCWYNINTAWAEWRIYYRRVLNLKRLVEARFGIPEREVFDWSALSKLRSKAYY